MNTKPLSESTEMYLKSLAELGIFEPVAISRLAERLGVTPVSANEMIHKLTKQGSVTHHPYKGAVLTEKGREVAVNVLRRQRLWEVFLYDHLKIEWALVYELACSLEHATAPVVTEALAEFLGNPSTCPRGNPIPKQDGMFGPLEGIPLSEVKIGGTVRVLAVTATATDVLKYLQKRNIMPGREIEVIEAGLMQGPLTLQVDGKEEVLGLMLAEFVQVEMIELGTK